MGLGGLPTVTCITATSIPGYRSNDTIGSHFANTVISIISNISIAITVNSYSIGFCLTGPRWPARRHLHNRHFRPSYRSNIPLVVTLQNTVISIISDIEVTIIVNGSPWVCLTGPRWPARRHLHNRHFHSRLP